MKKNDNALVFLMAEYEKLKDEQHKRIEFRDQMIYLTLVATGAVFSFSIEKTALNTALLVLPFVCTVMGWTYFTNDVKITKIGKYIRTVLITRLESISETEVIDLSFSWEFYTIGDKHRKKRKLVQLLIDLGIFILPGISSIAIFPFIHSEINVAHILFSEFEVIGLIGLSAAFIWLSNE
ncbi:MAG: hypothetical protein EOO20_01865 [Chryseobacterium sp.]|nr:MAG: hypothetical protein EOO20_01865 [Chryseobacterium sp.]